MLPQELGCGSGMTCWRRLRDWQELGLWDLIHFVLLDYRFRLSKRQTFKAMLTSFFISEYENVCIGGPPLTGQMDIPEFTPVSRQTAQCRSGVGVQLHGLAVFLIIGTLVLWLAILPLEGREKDQLQYGAGLIVNVPFAEAEVTEAVNEVAQNGTIRGTKEYNRDEYITGATITSSTRAFRAWEEGGKVFYKVRRHALNPRNFKNSGDVGTLAVRYVVQGQGEKNTVLRIDAVFVEDFRHTVHASNGSVESSEYKDVHDHLESMELIKQEATEVQKEHQELVNRKLLSKDDPSLALTSQLAAGGEEHTPDSSLLPAEARPIDESPEQHLQNLRRQIERLVKSPGAPLKSSPFRTASTLRSLPPGTEVLILISTPYWYGVETHDGQHGWMSRDQLEQLP
jgi:hypothetical protein